MTWQAIHDRRSRLYGLQIRTHGVLLKPARRGTCHEHLASCQITAKAMRLIVNYKKEEGKNVKMNERGATRRDREKRRAGGGRMNDVSEHVERKTVDVFVRMMTDVRKMRSPQVMGIVGIRNEHRRLARDGEVGL
jgi:hypothetical protein